MTNCTVLLSPTLTVPVLTTVGAPLGPVTVQLSEFTCSPLGNVNSMPMLAESAVVAAPGSFEGASIRADEQPTCPAISHAPAALRQIAWSNTHFRTRCLMERLSLERTLLVQAPSRAARAGE